MTQGKGKTIKVHCWKDKGDWIAEKHGVSSDEWIHFMMTGESATCMLEKDHQGEHQWTSDEDITVSFPVNKGMSHEQEDPI